MKKLLFAIGLFITVNVSAQTASEIGRIMNAPVVSITTATVSANNTNLFSIDLTTASTAVKLINIQIAGITSATITFQGSNDNFSTTDNIAAFTTGTSPTWQTSTTSNGTFVIPTYSYRYIRARTTTYSSGTITSVAYGSLNTPLPTITNSSTTISGTQKPSYGSTTSMTVTNLNSLANSATAGWQSARVSNLSTRATDYEINVKLTMANTAPGSDKAAYVYIVAWYTSDAGTTWFASSQGTTTLPTGSEGTTTINNPTNLRLLGVLNYSAQQMVLQDTWFLSNVFGSRIPDGFSVIIINFTGAAVSGSGNVVQYSPINDVFQ